MWFDLEKEEESVQLFLARLLCEFLALDENRILSAGCVNIIQIFVFGKLRDQWRKARPCNSVHVHNILGCKLSSDQRK